MSDGLTDCARSAESNANRFVKDRYPGLTTIGVPTEAPKKGTVVLVYEEWLDHVVEKVTDRCVVERHQVGPYRHEPTPMPIGDDWPVGFYQDHRIPREKEGSK